jgi:thymidine kinase
MKKLFMFSLVVCLLAVAFAAFAKQRTTASCPICGEEAYPTGKTNTNGRSCEFSHVVQLGLGEKQTYPPKTHTFWTSCEE